MNVVFADNALEDLNLERLTGLADTKASTALTTPIAATPTMQMRALLASTNAGARWRRAAPINLASCCRSYRTTSKVVRDSVTPVCQAAAAGGPLCRHARRASRNAAAGLDDCRAFIGGSKAPWRSLRMRFQAASEGRFAPGVFRPVVLGVTTAHLFAHLSIGAGPECRKVLGDLEGSASGREQVQE